MRLISSSIVAGLAAALCASAASAVIVPTYEIYGTQYGGTQNMSYWAASPNLLNGSTVTGPACTYNIGAPQNLTDGNIGTNAFYEGAVIPATVLIVLSTSSDINQIRSMSGHNNDRINQSYTISYTADASPTLASTFTDIGTTLTVFPHEYINTDPTGNSVRATFGDGTSSIVGGNAVTALKVVFNNLNGGTGGQPMYREFEASVPEPTALAVLGLSGLALMRRRRA